MVFGWTIIILVISLLTPVTLLTVILGLFARSYVHVILITVIVTLINTYYQYYVRPLYLEQVWGRYVPATVFSHLVVASIFYYIAKVARKLWG